MNYAFNADGRYVIIVIEDASLECAEELAVGGARAREEKQLRKLQETLRVLLDSPLSRSGGLLVYVHSSEDALVAISPEFKVPRKFQRFVPPVQRHLPADAVCYRLSHGGRE